MESVIDVVLNIVCPGLGLCTIVFCIVYMISGPHNDESGLHRKQKFSGFGIKLEVSSLTLFFVSGFAMLIIGGIYNLMIDRKAISVLKEEKRSLQKTLTELKKQTTRTYLVFPDANNGPNLEDRNLDNVKVYYTIFDQSSGEASERKYVGFHRSPSGLQVMLDDLTPNDLVKVFVEDGDKKWYNAYHQLPGFRLELKEKKL